ncbi:hypothetical protein [Geminicoccus harenae]|uniref:hypothetical protein n=1 Tax=Geminicoccus harenae TaxID=2498453 RepID=UPI00168B7216|nr:hypothetical protein [Geminicoccus harenae]
MSVTLISRFKTRRNAEMAVEHLVQELGLERTNIFVAAAGAENTAGEEKAGSDDEADVQNLENEGSPALNGDIEVSVDIQDETTVERVRANFREFNAAYVAEQ